MIAASIFARVYLLIPRINRRGKSGASTRSCYSR